MQSIESYEHVRGAIGRPHLRRKRRDWRSKQRRSTKAACPLLVAFRMLSAFRKI